MKHSDYENTRPDTSALIISTGPSTQELMNYHGKLHNYWDVIIGVNHSHRSFEKELDFHMVLEDKPQTIIDEINRPDRNPRKDLPRLVSPRSADKWKKGLNIMPTARVNDNHDFLHYNHGLLLNYGPTTHGTVTLQAIHWACILGCKNIYLIGNELRWKKNFNDHFFGDTGRRAIGEPNKLVFAERGITHTQKLDGWETTEAFLETAVGIDLIVEKILPDIGVTLYDFSDGLISNAEPLKLKEYCNEL